ncbi:hypothetical protein GTP46_29030 [Duganella sp. FT135W]|uniref:Uncharacterized protein n=1 Tax=Duganella flavida TaxID=2692175 RepID=A0A6L8KKH7_9BURK|nr:hypothetical protein [Duganella flavida]
MEPKCVKRTIWTTAKDCKLLCC